jgi:hypothetical protein
MIARRSGVDVARRAISRASRLAAAAVVFACGTAAAFAPAQAQTAASTPEQAQPVTCEPVNARAGREFGCFITARQELGHLDSRTSLFWHIDAFETRADAERARGPLGTVVESLGQIWLFTIAGEDWLPSGGRRVSVIGPLELVPAEAYAAVYMEGVFRPGMTSAVHRHPGVEAWHTLTGEMCLETPEGTIVQRAGFPGVMVRGGLPMVLTGTGTGIRRSLVLILQDASQPWSSIATDWTPKGLCRS